MFKALIGSFTVELMMQLVDIIIISLTSIDLLIVCNCDIMFYIHETNKLNMKKIVTLITLSIALLVANKSYAQLKKVAVISIYGNRNLSDNAMDRAFNEKLLKDSSYNVDGLVAKFANYVNDEMIKDFPFAFVPKDEVVNHPEYKKLGEVASASKNNETYDILDGKVSVYSTAPGYVPIASFGIIDDVKAIKQAFTFLPADVDGVMIAFITFRLEDQAGMMGLTVKKVRAYANVKIFNREGKRIFKLKESELSKESVTGAMGIVVEPNKVMTLVKSAFEELLAAMKKKMPKSLAKLAKKIDVTKED